MDENEFYREITKRICSSLELTTALQRALVYLKQVVPVDSISLHLYEQHLGAVKTIAIVTASERKVLDKVISLSLEGKASFEKPGTPNVRIVNHPETDPVISKIAEAMRLTNASALVMRLVIEGKRLGSLVLTTRGADRYTEEHARLLALLNEPVAIALSNALQHQEVIWLKDMLTDDNRYLHRELLRISGDEIIGEDFGLKNVMEMVRKVAPLESPVLLLGETGVGKGLIASAVHYLSRRSKGPFIVVNSGAIPETLIDSELFGHEKGAFTGAIEQKRGRFERADHGTIFLDEIGELPPQAQVRMLRVLQEKVIERVGGSRPISVDIRIIAATHRNLERNDPIEPFPAGSAVPNQCFSHHGPPVAGQERGYPLAGPLFYPQEDPGVETQFGSGARPGCHGSPLGLQLAGKCPRTRKRNRARDDPLPGRLFEIRSALRRAEGRRGCDPFHRR